MNLFTTSNLFELILKGSYVTMSSTTLFRWSGLCLLVGGLLLALFFLFHPTGGDPPTAQEASGSLYGLEHTLGVVALLLTLLGLPGIYARLAAQRPWLALLGCLLAFLGSALWLCAVVSEVSLVPSVATHASKLLAAGGALTSGLRAILILGSVLDGLGFLLVGITVLLLGGRARWAGDILILGAILLALPISWVITVIGAVVLGLGQIWLGYTIWSGLEIPPTSRWLSKVKMLSGTGRSKPETGEGQAREAPVPLGNGGDAERRGEDA